MNKTSMSEHPRAGPGALDQQGRGQAVPVGEAGDRERAQERGTILFVHGSSMASQPTFDLQVPGRPAPR